MEGFVIWLVAVAIAVIASGPGEKTQVVLLPDIDGHVGQVEVSTLGGKQLLTEAGQMTVVTDGSKPPSAVTTVDERDISAVFSGALDVEPVLPEKFLLYFKPSSSELTSVSMALLPQIAAAIEKRNATYVSIFGHSDRVGSAEYNIQLSTKRAMAVKGLLSDQGVVVENMEIASHGEGNPLIKTPDGVAEPQNRRVEVVVR
jgi:outer membrane protein OmpA-like peptidoglycan-associated protein